MAAAGKIEACGGVPGTRMEPGRSHGGGGKSLERQRGVACALTRWGRRCA